MLIMKRYTLIIIVILMSRFLGSAQENEFNFEKALSEIKGGNYNGTLLNNKLVEEYLKEYVFEAEKRALEMNPYIEDINFIVVEPESNIPRQLVEFNLGKVDEERKMILLSRSCLLDSNILKATLFRELSHYFGVPYENEGIRIMSINKPKDYSYGGFSENDIRCIEYDYLFSEVKKYIK
ncbi:hypothetical protein APF79_10070 [bacterium BRH_c32]|nr:MAG: hypothetical protein APF79_10070 [bacterium BRH_c32]